MNAVLQRLVEVDKWAGEDFDAIPATDLDQFRERVMDLLGAGEQADRAARPSDYYGFSFDHGVSRPNRAELKATHRAIRDVLDACVTSRYRNLPLLKFRISVGERHGYVNPAVFGGRVRDRCVLAVLMLLTRAGPLRVKTCPECHSAFIKTGRRKYCRRVECEKKRNAEYWAAVGHKYRPMKRSRKRRVVSRQQKERGR